MIIKECKECKLSNTRNKIVCGEGKGNILLLGEAPGKAEDMLGTPFIGKSGMILRKLLSLMSLEEVYITNLVKCRPPGNRNPTEEEVDKCLPHLSNELHINKPNIIIAVGRVAATHILDKNQPKRGVLLKVNNVLDYSPSFNLYVSHIYHPAAALYNPQLLSVLEADMRNLTKEINDIRNPHTIS